MFSAEAGNVLLATENRQLQHTRTVHTENTGAATHWCKESCHGENLIKIFAHPPSEKRDDD